MCGLIWSSTTPGSTHTQNPRQRSERLVSSCHLHSLFLVHTLLWFDGFENLGEGISQYESGEIARAPAKMILHSRGFLERDGERKQTPQNTASFHTLDALVFVKHPTPPFFFF